MGFRLVLSINLPESVDVIITEVELNQTIETLLQITTNLAKFVSSPCMSSQPTENSTVAEDPTTRFELITRNTEEVITEEEIWDISINPSGKRAYVGYEPTGELHLGHLVTVNKLIDLQKVGMDIIILLADVHAQLNEKGTLDEIRATAEKMKDQFIAAGLDPEQTEFVYGSDFQFNQKYIMDTHRLAQNSTVTRAKKAVTAGIASREQNLRLSQANYAVMQAVDIPHLNIDLAVGGMAQRKVHMLARDNLPSIGYEAPTCLHTPLVMGLDGEPMGSSKDNVVKMGDSHETIETKISGAFCPAGKLDDNPVVDIYKFHLFPRFDQITISRPEKFGGDVTYTEFHEFAEAFASGDLHPEDAKASAVEFLNEMLAAGRKEVK